MTPYDIDHQGTMSYRGKKISHNGKANIEMSPELNRRYIQLDGNGICLHTNTFAFLCYPIFANRKPLYDVLCCTFCWKLHGVSGIMDIRDPANAQYRENLFRLAYPADTWRNNNVITKLRRRFDAIMMLSLRCVPAGRLVISLTDLHLSIFFTVGYGLAAN